MNGIDRVTGEPATAYTPPEDIEADAGDVAALARVVTAQMKGNRWRDLTPLAVARAVLASDWIARHDADVAALALEELVAEIDPRGYGWTSIRDAERFKQRLRNRAAAIRGGAR